MKYAMYVVGALVAAFLIYKLVTRPHGTLSGVAPAGTGLGSESTPAPVPTPVDVTINSQEGAVAGSCSAFGKQCGAGGSTNITAEMGAARPMVSLTSPCTTGKGSGMNVAPASVSPWVKDMFAGSVQAGRSANPSDVNSVYDQSTVQTLDASGPVGFGLASPEPSPYTPSCGSSSQEYAQAKACTSCSM